MSSRSLRPLTSPPSTCTSRRRSPSTFPAGDHLPRPRLRRRKTLEERYAVPRELIVRTGDHFGHALKKSVELARAASTLFGHVGKWAKVAAGLFNTHCDYGDARLETLAACAGACGATPEQIRELLALPLAEEAVPLIERWGLSKTFDVLAERMHRRCALYAISRASLVEPPQKSTETRATPPENTVAFGVAVLSLKGEILGISPLCR